MLYVEFMKNSSLADSNNLMAPRLISASWVQKTFESHFLEMMYVELMKNFPIAVWNELLSVRLISPSSTQKRLIPTY